MGTAPQYPRTNFPALEFLNLAPGANVALSGRRRFVATATSHTAAANAIGATFTDSFLVEAQTFNNMGMYLHALDVQYIPLDATGHLTISSSAMGASLTTGSIVVPLGQAIATQLNPTAPLVALTEREKLILINDITSFNTQLGVTPTGNGLSIVTTFAVNNNDAAAHAFTIRMNIIYAWLLGVIE